MCRCPPAQGLEQLRSRVAALGSAPLPRAADAKASCGALRTENEELRELLQVQQGFIEDMLPAKAHINGDGSGAHGAAALAAAAAAQWRFAHPVTWAFLACVVFLGVHVGRMMAFEWSLYSDMDKTITWDNVSKFVSYRLDLWIARTQHWRESVLGFFTLCLVVVGGFLYMLVTGLGLGKSMWSAWVFVVDSGAHGDETEVHHRAVALLITVGGMIGFALMVSILTDGLQGYMDGIRSGRSMVCCQGHSLILGFSDKTIPLIHEIAEANRSEGGGIVVVLAECKRQEAEEEIACCLSEEELKGTTVVVRSGSAMLTSDLQIVSIQTARSIVVVSDTSLSPVQADEKTLRIMLCLRSLLWSSLDSDSADNWRSLKNMMAPKPLWSLKDLNQYSFSFKRKSSSHCNNPPLVFDEDITELEKCRRASSTFFDEDSASALPSLTSAEPLMSTTIVVELADVDNVPLVDILGGAAVETLVTHDFTGRMILQASRQDGMARVLERLIGFDGCEFYLSSWEGTVGRTFAEVAFLFADAVPVGVFPAKGKHILNPRNDYVVREGDRIIVVAEDNDTYTTADEPLFGYEPGSFGYRPPENLSPENILVCGWRRDFGDFIVELDATSAPGTKVTLLSTVSVEDRDKRFSEGNRSGHQHLQNIKLTHHVGDQTSRAVIEKLPIEEFHSIIIVSDEDYESEAMKADGRTCTTMLQVRDIRRTRRVWTHKFSLTCEVLDPRTRHLIEKTNLSEYVMSNSLIASALAMVSECREVAPIIRELLTSKGNEIWLRPAKRYLKASEQLSFWELSARCRDCCEVLLGYVRDGIIVINPPKKERPTGWTGEERMIVLAEN